MPEFDVIAVLEGKHHTPPLPDLQMIVQHDLTAVLAATARPAMRPPQSLAQHLQDAARHLTWQTACMQTAPLLPVRLDTPLTREGAAAMLTANHPFLTQLLTRYAGMAQVQVTVTWNEAEALHRFGADIAPSGDPQDMGKLSQQVALRLSMTIGAELASFSTEISPLPLAPGLVWSGVILLPLRRLSDLQRAVQRLQAIWPEGLHIRQIGPDPVTSFATLDLTDVTMRQLDQALTSFGLRSVADLGQLAMARRRRLGSIGRHDDAAKRAEIGEQAEILAAAARLPNPAKGFALCRIWTDGRVSAPLHDRAVA
jgi:hypothetical protein